MAKFEVGEVAILDVPRYPELTGLECTILKIGVENEDDYLIEVCGINPKQYGAESFTCYEHNLRKKRPPEELSTWEEIQKITDWNPKEKVHD